LLVLVLVVAAALCDAALVSCWMATALSAAHVASTAAAATAVVAFEAARCS
jgi:hypothetical protein